MRLELVRDWMSRDLVIAEPSLGLMEADVLMREHNIRRLPVVEDGRLVGIITYGDIREARPSTITSLSSWEMNYLLSTLQIAEVMTKDPKVISPDATIGEAADMMLANRISGLPVVDGAGHLVGIITESDIFRLVAHSWRKSRDDESARPYTHYEGR